jgi:hypothetical protein
VYVGLHGCSAHSSARAGGGELTGLTGLGLSADVQSADSQLLSPSAEGTGAGGKSSGQSAVVHLYWAL